MSIHVEKVKHLRLIHFSIITACSILIITIFLVQDIDIKYALGQVSEIERVVSEWDPMSYADSITQDYYLAQYTSINHFSCRRSRYLKINQDGKIYHFECSFDTNYYGWGFARILPDSGMFNKLFQKAENGFYRPIYRIEPPETIDEWVSLWNGMSKLEAGVLCDTGYVYFCDDDFKIISKKIRIEDSILKNEKKVAQEITLKLFYMGDNQNRLLKVEGFEAGYFLIGAITSAKINIIIPLKFSMSQFYELNGQYHLRKLIEGDRDESRHSTYLSRAPLSSFDKSFRSLYPYTKIFNGFKLSDLKTVIRYIHDNSNTVIKILGLTIPVSSIHKVGGLLVIFLQLYFFLFVYTIESLNIWQDDAARSFPWVGLMPERLPKLFSIFTFSVLPFLTVAIIQMYPFINSHYHAPYSSNFFVFFIREFFGDWNYWHLSTIAQIAVSGTLSVLVVKRYNDWII